MIVSIITPTHNPTWLPELWASLKAQTHQEFQLVVVPNGPCQISDLPPEMLGNHRVKIVPFTAGHWAQSVGAMKRFGFGHADGDLLVELDHDDWLTPNALEEMVRTVEGTGVGFLYSDCVEFFPDGRSNVYGAAFGWETYEHEYDGKKWQVNRSFEPTPSSLRQIFYAPNHVRAWTRDGYIQSGGHDPWTPLGDDHELVVRTYLAGVEFAYIPKVLYFYRLHGGTNTWQLRNGEVQEKQGENCRKYTLDLVHEWCRRNQLKKLDLGGRIGCPGGYTSVDLFDAEVCCDIAKDGLPFADNSVGAVRAFDFLEHMPPERVPFVMNEIWRVLAPGGWLLSMTPSTDGRGAWQDPTHISFWNENSFLYYTRAEQQKFVPQIKAKFQTAKLETNKPNQWCIERNIAYVHFHGVALKGQRQPGFKEI